MPKKLDDIFNAVKKKLSGKINPRTKKPYTESEMHAIAQSQFNESKTFQINMPITNHWSEEVEVEKSGFTKGKGKSEEKFIQVTVSGVEEDRDGERISHEAALDMVEQYKSGRIPLYPNHGRDPVTGERAYNWQDMMGVWTDAFLEDGKIIATARLNKAHPDFQKFWDYMEGGMPLGFSIGGKTVDEFMEDVDDGTE